MFFQSGISLNPIFLRILSYVKDSPVILDIALVDFYYIGVYEIYCSLLCVKLLTELALEVAANESYDRFVGQIEGSFYNNSWSN